MDRVAITLNRALQLQAQNFPNKIFIYHKDGNYTYGKTNELVNRFAAYLQAHGIKANDKVCLMLPRVPELIIAFLATTKIGVSSVPVNYLFPARVVVDFVRRVAPKAIVSNTKLTSPELDTCLGDLNLLCIDTDNTKDGWVPWRSTVAVSGEGGDSVAQADDLAYLNYTTGSSGQPKGALATHANIYWNTRSAVETFGLNAEDVHLCMFASFAHPHEIFARPLYTGASLVLQEEINPKTIIRTINRYSVSCMMGLAPMYEAMATHCRSMTVDSLRLAESGGMFTRRSINESFRQHFGLPIFSVWGSTETTGIALANTEAAYRIDGSMGRVCPYYQVKLIDEAGRDVTASGEVGEMLLKGPGVISGYNDGFCCRNEEGWYASGDMVKKDESGFFYFVERKSCMIKLAGLKVYPLQIELCLMEHPDIVDIAVLGLPDARKGCIPIAFVVAKENIRLENDGILAFCKGRLPSYMIPKKIEVVASLPKIGSGKTDKRALIESLALC